MESKIQWCINQHKNTNHFYDKYLPYEFHLRMTVQVAEDFKHLIPENLFEDSEEIHRGIWEKTDRSLEVIKLACWGHDLIEDCRISYNDCKSKLNVGRYLHSEVSDIIYAVSNEKGKNRSERANENYYRLIRETPGAVFVKLCDRIANVQYSKMTKSRQFDMYQKENSHFLNMLGFTPSEPHFLYEMANYLSDLLKNENE